MSSTKKTNSHLCIVTLEAAITLLLTEFGLIGCTGSGAGFKLQQQQESFSTQLSVNTKVDLLWVVDNSSSMDVHQQKLRAGFAAFAQKYMQPTWDIRLAVITTDTYLANPAYAAYLGTKIPGSTGFTSAYITSRKNTFVEPSFNPSLVNFSSGSAVFSTGVTVNNLVPAWGPNYGRLLAGLHDGPITGFCFEGLPYFLRGNTQCAIRDDQTKNIGTSHCLNPDTGVGESSLTQCVNTVENDSVRSGVPIISTMPPAGTPGDATWTQNLINNFIVNASVGSAGHGAERGMQSVLEMLTDNEKTASAFFRPGSIRGIIFLSDEDDQTMPIPANPTGLTAWSNYTCDQSSLLSANSSNTAAITGNAGFCCNTAANNCAYGEGLSSAQLSCHPKTVGSLTYTVSVCPRDGTLTPVPTVKTAIDTFFNNLDGTSNPNYFIASIVANSDTSIQSIKSARDLDDTAVGSPTIWSVDRGDRYIELGNEVQNGSMSMDIGASDYTQILDSIGNSIIAKEGTFTLTRAPAGNENTIVTVQHADGSAKTVSASSYSVSGTVLTINDLNVILSFAATDKINISYQPSTVF